MLKTVILPPSDKHQALAVTMHNILSKHINGRGGKAMIRDFHDHASRTEVSLQFCSYIVMIERV